MDFFNLDRPNFDSLSMPQDAGLTPAGPQLQQASYDPKALLNPKAATGNTNRLNENPDDDEGDFGAGSMIEKLNGVTNREDAPGMKRMSQARDDDSNERKKQKASGPRPGGSGILSDHLNQEQKKMAPPGGTIDLTNDDDDDDGGADDVQLVGANAIQAAKDDEKEVCLGCIKADSTVHRIPNPSPNQRGSGKDMWIGFRAVYKQGRADTRIIELFDKQDNKFGAVDSKTAAAMNPILTGAASNKTRFKIFVLPRVKKPDEYPGKKVSQSLKLDIYVYAPLNKAQSLGRYLSQRQIYLTTPVLEKGEIYNPHVPKTFGPAPVVKAVARPQHSGYSVQRSAEEIRQETSNMFDNLAKAEDLPEMSANAENIKSELMAHQKQALYFLTEHERSDYGEMEMAAHSLWKYRSKANGQPSWYNIITGVEVFEKPHQTQGGILADVMGLGKTLSILALLTVTLEEAREFRRQQVPQGTDAVMNSQATLIVCPKSVMSNWSEQIKTHTDGLSVYQYHGTTRTQDLKFLSKQAIVLTTYNTVAIEFGPGSRKNSALGKINFFRIVLDEGHSIRNTTNRQSKACCALNAQRRWAVTGTPVQNALTDLGALVKFIRLSPFDDSAAWTQHIMAPFKLGDPDVIEKLQILVGSVTLRRMKNTIDLPEREEIRQRLEFSREEALLYKQFAKQCRSKLHQVTGGGDALRGKAYAHVLKSIGRLRAICAHGREMLSEDDMMEIDGDDPNNAIVIDIGDDEEQGEDFISEKQAYETFYMMQESEQDNCSGCGKKLSAEKVRPDGTVDVDADDETSPEVTDEEDAENELDEGTDLLGHFTTCLHLICAKCTETHKQEAAEKMSVDRYYSCQYCGGHQRFGMYPILSSVLKQFREQRQDKSKQGKTARWDDTTYTGPHTKVKALLQDLQKSAEETEQLPAGEPPIRSVVFSGWTAYLDLIEYALQRNSIGFVRIDGSMSVKARTKALEYFNTIKEVTVLLVSIKAGGQGLNFTAANRAYVMEPQFNPGVEQQAVDRIHRIGQTRPVRIIHYIMNESVEEGVLALQEKKSKLAQLSMEKKRSKAEANKQQMDDLRALFK